MCSRLICLSFLFLFFTFSLHAQINVDISGSVQDASSNGIQGATVRLGAAKLSGTTDVNGDYSIIGTTTAVIKGIKNLILQSPGFHNKRLLFGVAGNIEKVRMDLFDLMGRHVCTVVDQSLERGNYTVNPFSEGTSSQIYFVKLQIGGRVSILKTPLIDKAGRGNAGLRKINGIDNPQYFAKSAAVVDTLIASASGFKTGRLEIESYTGTYDFTLERADFGLASPDDSAMITDTHRPILTWNEDANAVRYEVWLNISRTDYDWAAPGPLIDRYTKVAEVTETSYTTDSLQDRWTYKWYVVAVDGAGGRSQSEVRVFSKYIPRLEQVDDGVDIVNGCRDLNKNGTIEPFEDWHNRPEVRVNDLMSRMSVEQRAMQLVYGEGADVGPGGGWFYFWPLDPQRMMNNQLVCADAAFGMPFISAGDQINGYKVVVPNQAMLAASRNNDIVYQCGDLFRRCMRANGAFGNLGPLAEINTCIMYWRVQEGCGEDADLAAAQVRALIAGYHKGPELNPSSYLECLKHWPGQGAGGEGSVRYDWVTIKWHMKSWIAAVEAGLENAMPGYASCSLLATAGRGAGDDPGIIGYFRDSINYHGIITTDWLPSSAWINAINAGADVMGGAGFNDGYTMLAEGVGNEIVQESRLNDACRKVLSVKFRMGIVENPYPLTPNQCDSAWNALRSEGIHIEAARQGMTLLKNNGVLPFSNLNSGDNIVVTGPLANSTNCTAIWYSGWNEGSKTFAWWIGQRADQDGINVVESGSNIRAAVIIVGEAGYTHSGGGSIPTSYDMSQAQSFKNAGVPVVIVYVMPRPITVSWEADNADAMVVMYRPGDGGPQALAEFLFGDYQPKGKLPWQLPKTVAQISADRVDLPYDMGATEAEVSEIRALIDAGQPVPAVYGDPQFQWGAGLQSW